MQINREIAGFNQEKNMKNFMKNLKIIIVHELNNLLSKKCNLKINKI